MPASGCLVCALRAVSSAWQGVKHELWCGLLACGRLIVEARKGLPIRVRSHIGGGQQQHWRIATSCY